MQLLKLPELKKRIATSLLKAAGVNPTEVMAGLTVPQYAINQPAQHLDADYDAESRAYQVSETVFRCVNARMMTAARVPLKFYRAVKSGKEELPMTHILNERFNLKPNPFTSAFELKMDKFACLDLDGNCYWYLHPDEVWSLTPRFVSVIPDRKRFVSGYRYQLGSGNNQTFDNAEIAHFKNFNPRDIWYGQSTLQAVKRKVITEIRATIWNQHLLDNFARIDFVLSTPQTLGVAVAARVQKAMAEQLAKGGVLPIFEGGIEPKPISLSPKDMEFIEAEKSVLYAICRGFDVPPARAGILELANYSNMDTQDKLFGDSIYNLLALDESVMNRDVCPFYDKTAFCEYDKSQVPGLVAEFGRKVEAEMKLLANGARTPNQIIENLQLGEPYEAGNRYYMSTALIEVGEAKPPEPAKQATPHPEATHLPSAKTLRLSGKDGSFPDSICKTEESRVKEWKAFDARTRRFEKSFGNWYESEMDDMASRVKARLTEKVEYLRATESEFTAAYHGMMNGGTETATKMLEKARREVGMTLLPMGEDKTLADGGTGHYLQIVNDTTKTELLRLGVETSFSVDDPRAVKMAKKQAGELVKNIMPDVRVSLGEEIGDGLALGETMVDLKHRVDVVFDGKKANSMTVARTEVIRASNESRVFGYKISEVVDSKEWLSSRDDAVREATPNSPWDHTSGGGADGQVVDLDSDFKISGESLAYPGASGGSPGNVINCRCTVLPIVKKEGD